VTTFFLCIAILTGGSALVLFLFALVREGLHFFLPEKFSQIDLIRYLNTIQNLMLAATASGFLGWSFS